MKPPAGRASTADAVVEKFLRLILEAASADRGVLLRRRGRTLTPLAAVSARRGRATPSALPRVLRLPVALAGRDKAVLELERSGGTSFTRGERRLVTLLAPQLTAALQLVDEHRRELEALHALVNPPFLHNAFSVIAQLATADGAKAEDAILMLSRLYRYVLSSSPEHSVPLAQEVAISRDYLALEKHRLGERVRTEIVVKGPLEHVQVPPLILHSLLESSVSHGVAMKLGTSRVRLEIAVGPRQCRLRVEDDGLAWAVRRAQVRPRLRDVKRALALHYPRRHSLHIDKQIGLAVEIRLPCCHTRDVRRGNSDPLSTYLQPST